MGTKAPGALERTWGGGWGGGCVASGKSQIPLSLQGPLAKLAAVFLQSRAPGAGWLFLLLYLVQQVSLLGLRPG